MSTTSIGAVSGQDQDSSAGFQPLDDEKSTVEPPENYKNEAKEPLLDKKSTANILPKDDKVVTFEQSAQDAKEKWPSRGERFLHQVQFDKKGQAFAGWTIPDVDENERWFDNEAHFLAKFTNSNEEYIHPKTKEKRKYFPVKPKKDRRIVFIDTKIKRVSDIDTNKESFRTVFHYYLTWLATYEEYQSYNAWEKNEKEKKQTEKASNVKKDYGEDKSAWTPSWVPYIEYTNATEVTEQEQISEFKMKRGDHDSYGLPKYEVISRHKRSTSNLGNLDEPDPQLPLISDKDKKKLSWDIYMEQLGFDPRKGSWIRVQYEADVTFSEQLELESFPFDCQDFTMVLKLSKEGYEVADLLPFPRAGDFLTLDTQFSASEWNMRNIIAEFFFTDPMLSKSLQSYTAMAIRIKASRVWASYATEYAITFCMFALGLGTFALGVNSSELGNRLAYCVVFLLADVSTLQLVGNKLPEIQYMTLLDLYTFSCFLFLFSITLWSCLAGGIPAMTPHDNIAFWVFFGAFCSFQIGYVVFAWYSRKWERSKLIKTGEELEKQNRRNVCLGLCCLRGGHETISLKWEREEFVGEVKDLFAKEKAYVPKQPALVAYGNFTAHLRQHYRLT